MEVLSTIDEFVAAFILVFAASSLVYIFGRWLSPKPVQSENEKSTYVCGERGVFQKLKINVSLYKYLIYFVILDSSVLLLAFASSALSAANMPLFMVYLLTVAVSVLLLREGDQ